MTARKISLIRLGKWDKAIECYTAALNEYDSREDKNDIFNPPSSKDYTSEEQSAVLSIIHNIGIIYYLTGQNSKEYALSSKYARILQLEERTTENFNREYPTMRGRVPSRCDFSNGMLYYEESFVEGIQTTNGSMDIDVPQDRKSTFEPQIVKKRQKDISDIDQKIISMYAKGMTTRQISETIEDIYGFEASEGFISDVTDKIMPQIEDWQNRPLDEVYPILYMMRRTF